jgi:hypothetical protein
MEFYMRQKHAITDEFIEEMASKIEGVFLDNVMDYMKVDDIDLIDKEDLDDLFDIVLDAIDFNEG